MTKSRVGVITKIYGNFATVRMAGSSMSLKRIQIVGNPDLLNVGDTVTLAENDNRFTINSYGGASASSVGSSGLSVISAPGEGVIYEGDIVDLEHDATKIRGKLVSTATPADESCIVYDSASGAFVFSSVSAVYDPTDFDWALRADGTRELSDDWDAGSFEIRAEVFKSDVATGTAPLIIASSTLVSNLNADMLDSYNSSEFGVLAENETVSGRWSFSDDTSFSDISSHLLPSITDTYRLGDETQRWLSLYAAESWADTFIINTITLLNGMFYITKYVGTLTADIDSSVTTIDFGVGDTILAVGDYVIFKSESKLEYITLGSLVSGTTWNVTRSIDDLGNGSSWNAGAPFAVLGQDGDGRIELSAITTPRISIIEQGGAYNAQDELIRLGDLNGLADYEDETYGIFIGDYGGDSWMAYDQGNGLRIRGDALIDGTVTADKLLVGDNHGLFASYDGAFLVNSNYELTNGGAVSSRGQVMTISDSINITDGRWPGSRGFQSFQAFTNYCENPIIEVDLSWFSYTATYVTRSTTAAKYGAASAKLTASGGYVSLYETGDTVADGDSRAFSAWIYVAAGMNPADCGIYIYDSTNSDTLVIAYPTKIGQWEQVSVVATNASGSDAVLHPFISNTAADSSSICYADGFSWSRTAYRVPFIYGDFAYADWAGTAHESTSSVGTSSLRTTDMNDFFVGNETWSVAFWWQPFYDADEHEWAGGTSVGSLLFDVYHGTSSNRSSIRYQSETQDRFRLYIGGTYANGTAGRTFERGDWVHIAATFDFDSNSYKLYVDGVLDITSALSKSAPATISSLYIGGVNNSITDDFSMYNGVLTEAEVIRLYNNTGPLTDQYSVSGPGMYITDGNFVLATSVDGARTLMDSSGWWVYDSEGNSAFGLSLEDGVSWAGLTIDAGDRVLGNNTINSAAQWWDADEGQIKFVGGGSSTVQVYIDTDGTLAAGGGNVKINEDGIQGTAINGGIWNPSYGYSVEHGNYISRIWHSYETISGTYERLNLELSLSGTVESYVKIEYDTGDLEAKVSLGAGGNLLIVEEDRVLLPNAYPLIVADGLYVGSTGTDPDADDVWCDGEISTDGGTTKWNLGGYSTTAPTADGYVEVEIDGETIQLLCNKV